MKTIALEIRDRATFIPAIAVKLESDDPVEVWLMWKGGYPPDMHANTICLIHLGRGEGHIDPQDWRDKRTMEEAHKHIIKNFNKLKTGDVVDVEFVLGEVPAPKQSERAKEHTEHVARMERLKDVPKSQVCDLSEAPTIMGFRVRKLKGFPPVDPYAAD